jgi:hypothetical protein
MNYPPGADLQSRPAILSGLVLAGLVALAAPASAQESAAPSAPRQGFYFKPDAGFIYQADDFRLTTWGFAERLFDPDGPDAFRRVRQGAEVDFPRITDTLRAALVYEIDLTNTDFFDNGFGGNDGFGRRNFENLFVALQDANDPGRFRVLIGENTHILSRDDNLSSGNLPTINRSLILEEHGSVNSFGTQWGVQFQRALSDTTTLQLSAADNRGSLNAAQPRWEIGNSLAGKLIVVPINEPATGRRLSFGIAVDHTRDITNRDFTLATAISQAPLASVPATGDKLTGEGDVAYTFPLFGHPMTLEAEALYSTFSASNSDVGGGYVMAQYSLFDTADAGDLDVFARIDLVSLGQESVDGRATQRALRAGFNYNLPHAGKLVNLHLEYAHNTISGPALIVTGDRASDEFRAELRFSLQQYVRH